MWSNELLILLFVPFVVLFEFGEEDTNIFTTVWKRDGGKIDLKKSNNFFMSETVDVSGNGNTYGTLDNPQMSQNFRRRRSNYRSQKDFNKCKKNGTEKVIVDKPTIVKSNVIPKLKPPTVLHSYPFQVAVFLDDYNKQHLNYKKTGENVDNLSKPILQDKDLKNNEGIAFNNTVKDKIVNNNVTETINLLHKIDDGKVNNKSKINSKYDKQINYDVFKKKGESVWVQQIPPIKDDLYKVIPKHNQAETINEKTMIKILTILTRTFRKIMLQHQHMKNLHSSLQAIINEFRKQGDDVLEKLQIFDAKYENMVKFEEKINEFDAKLDYRDQYMNEIKRQISLNIENYKKQQANFFEQQKQFYNLQKVMIAQNENINSKQESIAKSQNDISKKQNIFAQMLKKNKQFNYPFTKTLKQFLSKQKNRVVTKEINKTPNTRQSAENSESIKIDLFALPTNKPLENQDNLILQEKDVRHVDDLIFKYYFNNTFIDNLIKNKIFPVVERQNNKEDVTKGKRSDSVTLLFPVNKTINLQHKMLNRKRRWILHHNNDFREDKITRWSTIRPYGMKSPNTTKEETATTKTINNHTVNKSIQKFNDDPFLKMTEAFCKEIGQNENEQSMKWCIEKALRRLKSIDPRRKFVAVSKSKKGKHAVEATFPPAATSPPVTTATSSTSTPSTLTTVSKTEPPQLQPTKPVKTNAISQEVNGIPDILSFFPGNDELEKNLQKFGNDELEKNLQEFELKPDTEGTVYFDRSLHISDLEREELRSDESDIMPGLIPDSNSRVELDPDTLNLQSIRRASVRKFNENLLNKIRSGKLKTRLEKWLNNILKTARDPYDPPRLTHIICTFMNKLDLEAI